MALDTRSSVLHSVIASARATDATGDTLDIQTSIVRTLELLRDLRHRGRGLYVAGNGGSAAIASHAVTDFLNIARLRAMTLHDSALITCMSNDYGYDNAVARILSTLVQPGDALIAISSSGQSRNICNAAEIVRELGGSVITLSGFRPDNALRKLGDLNIWLDSRDYGMVELGHQFVLHNISDRLSSGENL